ncbi:unnamed protein product, partial [Mesorhabditis belari]|uniref:Serine protease K12H4.7 n=1 Tax=Mesorhabditis belari TaxID=2138241 RepID=A0AAF3FQW4_9BILA
MRNTLVLALFIGSISATPLIFPRGKHRPPFLLGRPPGGQLRSSFYHATGGQHSLVGDDNPYPWVETLYFTQKLDHYNQTSRATWQQKYYHNQKYYDGKGLIFLMIGGEGPEPIRWAGNPDFGAPILWRQLADQKYGVRCPQTVHHSNKPLADLATFIMAMNKKYAFSNPRWVTFGGSYPGSLSAFFRAKYPDLTVGAIASSAPVNLKLDFYEYAMVVEDDVTITDPTCPGEIRKAFDAMQKLSLSAAGRETLNTIWNLQPKFDTETTKLDITNFLANVYSLFQGMIQYTYDGQSQMTQTNITARALCNMMTNQSVADPIQRAYNVWLWYQSFYGDPDSDITIFPNSYWDMISSMSMKNVNDMDENGADRGWMWLCCNEIGFLQTTDQGRNIFGATVPLNYFLDMCTDLFGSAVTSDFVRDKNIDAENFYQFASEATNIVLPNGSLDPWHALGTYTVDAANGVAPYLINGTAHCSDMYPIYDGEPPALVAARLFIEQNLAYFINNSTQPTIPTIVPPISSTVSISTASLGTTTRPTTATTVNTESTTTTTPNTGPTTTTMTTTTTTNTPYTGTGSTSTITTMAPATAGTGPTTTAGTGPTTTAGTGPTTTNTANPGDSSSPTTTKSVTSVRFSFTLLLLSLIALVL